MRLNRNTLIFVVILAVIIAGAALLLRDNGGSSEDATDPTTTPQAVFPDLTSDAVTTLSISRRRDESDATVTAETVLVARQVTFTQDSEGNWTINVGSEETEAESEGDTETESEREVDQTRIAQAISTLVGLRYRESFETDNLEQFGLADPAYDVNFTAGEESYRLRVGNKNPGGAQYYALIGDDEQVYLLTSVANTDTVLNLLSDLPYVVEPTPTPVPVLTAPGPVFTGFTAQDITSFTLSDSEAGEELVLIRDPETQEWSIEGSDEAVEQGLVNIVLGQFGATTAVDKVPGDNLEVLGLDSPSKFILAGINDEENYIIALGDTDPTGTRYYARVNEFEDIAVLEAEPIDFIFDMLENPPIVPEATPEVTAEGTEPAEGTDESTEAAEMTEAATAEASGD